MAFIRQTIITKHSSDTFASKEEARAKLHSDMGLTDEMLAERRTIENRISETKVFLEDKTGVKSIRDYENDDAFLNWYNVSKGEDRQRRIDACRAGWTINISFELVYENEFSE